MDNGDNGLCYSIAADLIYIITCVEPHTTCEGQHPTEPKGRRVTVTVTYFL